MALCILPIIRDRCVMVRYITLHYVLLVSQGEGVYVRYGVFTLGVGIGILSQVQPNPFPLCRFPTVSDSVFTLYLPPLYALSQNHLVRFQPLHSELDGCEPALLFPWQSFFPFLPSEVRAKHTAVTSVTLQVSVWARKERTGSIERYALLVRPIGDYGRGCDLPADE